MRKAFQMVERFECLCPTHGVVAARSNMDARLDPLGCAKCDRLLRFALQSDVQELMEPSAAK
jgi:hypothetical protein